MEIKGTAEGQAPAMQELCPLSLQRELGLRYREEEDAGMELRLWLALLRTRNGCYYISSGFCRR